MCSLQAGRKPHSLFDHMFARPAEQQQHRMSEPKLMQRICQGTHTAFQNVSLSRRHDDVWHLRATMSPKRQGDFPLDRQSIKPPPPPPPLPPLTPLPPYPGALTIQGHY